MSESKSLSTQFLLLFVLFTTLLQFDVGDAEKDFHHQLLKNPQYQSRGVDSNSLFPQILIAHAAGENCKTVYHTVTTPSGRKSERMKQVCTPPPPPPPPVKKPSQLKKKREERKKNKELLLQQREARKKTEKAAIKTTAVPVAPQVNELKNVEKSSNLAPEKRAPLTNPPPQKKPSFQKSLKKCKELPRVLKSLDEEEIKNKKHVSFSSSSTLFSTLTVQQQDLLLRERRSVLMRALWAIKQLLSRSSS